MGQRGEVCQGLQGQQAVERVALCPEGQLTVGTPKGSATSQNGRADTLCEGPVPSRDWPCEGKGWLNQADHKLQSPHVGSGLSILNMKLPHWLLHCHHDGSAGGRLRKLLVQNLPHFQHLHL
ncbi:hypothetical protein MC885_011518 [Smutsia gigantea]|nr:hypothetical protein MC885_011518 [Smutsia gigantea]